MEQNTNWITEARQRFSNFSTDIQTAIITFLACPCDFTWGALRNARINQHLTFEEAVFSICPYHRYPTDKQLLSALEQTT